MLKMQVRGSRRGGRSQTSTKCLQLCHLVQKDAAEVFFIAVKVFV